MFQNHKLEKTDDGYNVILYLEPNQTEFAKELGAGYDPTLETDLKKGAVHYLRTKVPNLRVNVVKVMMGSMIIASIPLTQGMFANPAEASSITKVKSQNLTYTVANGDTLYSIAKRFNINVDDIKKANNLPGNTIKTGQSLTIPTASYTVKGGDTLYRIAQNHQTNIDVIMKANHFTEPTIFAGQSLFIPTSIQKEEEATPQPVLVDSSHTVEAGDTLYRIANQYGISVDELKHANGLTSNTIGIGQTLAIPKPQENETPKQSTNYSVQAGDSLFLIAKKFGTSVDQIKQTNGLTSILIRIGQVLTIPAAQTQTEKPVLADDATYTVKAGDTLIGIAAFHNTTVQAIKETNGLPSDRIRVGQILTIPGHVSEPGTDRETQESTPTKRITYKTHTVQAGDNIWALSTTYGIPQAELLRANNLTNNSTLSIGQTLRIPVHEIGVHPTVSERHGEYLDWWTEAQYVFPIDITAKVTDFTTGISFYVTRTIGANHADVEPSSSKDTEIIKEIWGGDFSWKERAVLVEVNGHRIAASMTSMPHDIEYIKDNNFNGHTDIHFKNSTRHNDGQVNPRHQEQIQIAAGLIQS
ncbi:LysM repeat-containing protein [Salinibacillus kushneri]|uniref:LysM repeat-containing protein n=1 Tax=Salinibacillus kushneri TaxID=237682 RepID=A0A1I0GJN7_9BACI|nr:LysM peptidoglycan-binding domain-containing protein [Salinibacillus kushneri]SET71364.1 LysM repeat-containing protein [Salinibacillus kushneri]